LQGVLCRNTFFNPPYFRQLCSAEAMRKRLVG